MIKFNYLLLGFLALYILQLTFDAWLERLNQKHLAQSGERVPPSFDGFIDAAKLANISAYTLQKSRLGLIGKVTSETILLGLIVTGFLPILEYLLERQGLPYYVAGLLFFLVPGAILYAVELPFDYYRTFYIEEQYGFNRSSPQTWAVDHLKAGSVSLVLSALLLFILFWTISVFPHSWWFYGFLLVSLIQIVMTVLYPVVIAPLFNKFQPIADAELADRIKRLMEANGIRVKKILQMDAGRRSRHTNAYFTGLGKTKQIVLFDTLLESHPAEEILAVLAHEAGHYQRKHILKQVLVFDLTMLVGFYLTYRLMTWPLFYQTFGFVDYQPYIMLFFAGILWQKLGYFVKPLFMSLSRRFECQADRFAAGLIGSITPLTTAFKRMAADNLANLNPHPLYVVFHYTHPPLLDRVSDLERLSQTQAPPAAQSKFE